MYLCCLSLITSEIFQLIDIGISLWREVMTDILSTEEIIKRVAPLQFLFLLLLAFTFLSEMKI